MPLTLSWLEIAGIPLSASAICALAGAYVLGSRSRIAPLVSVFWLGAACIVASAALPFAQESWSIDDRDNDARARDRPDERRRHHRLRRPSPSAAIS
jgi:hypothetical protein